MLSCGGRTAAADTVDQAFSGFDFESGTLEEPRSVFKWMERFYLALFSGKTQRFRADAEYGGGSRQGVSDRLCVSGLWVSS